MKVLEINYTDLPGRIFNGYDLHVGLLKNGIDAKQVVREKLSKTGTVLELPIDKIMHLQLLALEQQYSVTNMLLPYANELVKLSEYKDADILHFHIVHSGLLSVLDYPKLMNNKKSVWTIHDPWILTGKCVHPLHCEKWKSGCKDCTTSADRYFDLQMDNESFMWNTKRTALEKIDPVIVVASDFMKKYIEESPLTKHFSRIYKIPFGIETDKYHPEYKLAAREKLGLSENKCVIGFRADDNFIKGCKYLYEALEGVAKTDQIELVAIGSASIPQAIKRMYHVVEFGWIYDQEKMIHILEACDIFVMPSMAETFGLMAIEAMAAGCTVIAFKDTVVEEVIGAPKYGIVVEYLSADALRKEIERLILNPKEIEIRGQQGHDFIERTYKFENYVSKHIELYQAICDGDI